MKFCSLINQLRKWSLFQTYPYFSLSCFVCYYSIVLIILLLALHLDYLSSNFKILICGVWDKLCWCVQFRLFFFFVRLFQSLIGNKGFLRCFELADQKRPLFIAKVITYLQSEDIIFAVWKFHKKLFSY